MTSERGLAGARGLLWVGACPRAALGRLEGALEVARDILLAIAGRHGPVPDGIQARVAACEDLARLRALTLDLADDVDEPAVEALLAALAAAG